MKEIKLECFSGDEVCRNSSALENFNISDPLEKEFSLQIVNRGEKDCQLELSTKNFTANDSLDQVQLLLSSQGELFFQDNLGKFFKEETDLSTIEADSSKTYFFHLDFMNLAINKENFVVSFDLLLNFDCKQISKISSEKTEIIQATRSTVLAASSSALPKKSFLRASLFLYLLSSLFVIVFFVIIKFINGKKKKK